MSTDTRLATFAGGCFWCLQGPFDAEPGVFNVRVGYAGDSESRSPFHIWRVF